MAVTSRPEWLLFGDFETDHRDQTSHRNSEDEAPEQGEAPAEPLAE